MVLEVEVRSWLYFVVELVQLSNSILNNADATVLSESFTEFCYMANAYWHALLFSCHSWSAVQRYVCT